MKYSSNNIKTKGVWRYYLLAIYIIYSTDSLIIGLGLDKRIEYGSYGILCILCLYFFISFLLKSKGKIKSSEIMLFVCIYTIALSAIYNFDKSFISVIKIASLVVGFYIAKYMNAKLFIKAYVICMTMIGIFSMFTFTFSNVLATIDFFPRYVSSNGQQFVSLIFSNLRVYPTTFRNWGPIWEPGAFQAYLIIALFFVFFDDLQLKYKNIIIILLLMTILTTFSTTGFIALPFIIIGYILDSSQKKKIQKILIICGGSIFLMWFINRSGYFEILFTDKFKKSFDIDRVATIIYGIKLWLRNPIFGYSSGYTKAFYDLTLVEFSITNTFIANLVVYGTVMGVYSLTSIIGCICSYRHKLLVNLLISIGLIICFSGEKFLYTPIISFLMFYRFNKDKGVCKKNGK